MEKDGDFAGAAESDVAPFVCCAPVLPRDMVVVPDLVSVVGVEGLVADMAEGLIVEFVGEPSIPLQSLLVVVELHCVLLEAHQLGYQPLHAILHHPRLVPDVEFGEGRHDVIAHRAERLTLVVKRSVPPLWMTLASGNYQHLEVCVDHEGRLRKVSIHDRHKFLEAKEHQNDKGCSNEEES